MTPEQRKSAENGIWLCQTHARLIDSDEASYPPEALRGMKMAHEGRVSTAMREGSAAALDLVPVRDLIGIGPDIVASGCVLGGSGEHWRVEIHQFIRGTQTSLLAYLEHLGEQHDYDRFVVATDQGDGRVIGMGAQWTQERTLLRLDLPIKPRFPREQVQQLGPTLAIDDDGDINLARGMVGGIDALHQHLLLCFGLQRGESRLSPRFGSRTTEYYSLYGGTAWFERLLQLEAIRLAAIPYFDEPTGATYTPFQCVDRVRALRLRGPGVRPGTLVAALSLDVKGIGEYEDDISVFITGRNFE